MQSSNPIEYLTLKSGESENYGEIYDKKLLSNQTKCRFGPRYGKQCAFCQSDTLQNHGFTSFAKVRLNITAMKIVEDDFAFAKVHYGNPVPFGTAGDCYSNLMQCQQVIFY